GNALLYQLCERQQAELIRACQSGESCRLNLQLSASENEPPDRHRRLKLAIAPLPLEQQSESLVQITLKDISRYQDLSLYEAA
ncbi:hypothetical protein ACMYML_23670, partial [Salmonella enterica subsp. enterica serovar Enteritidis]|uniref:hypothetical protein n=1 Tax=Salmonella enterica TaxID=28901 RepID=UPI0039EA33FE